MRPFRYQILLIFLNCDFYLSGEPSAAGSVDRWTGAAFIIFTLMLQELKTKWSTYFGKSSPDVIVRAPGRVNIIGEHTDYNEGWVLPGALGQSTYILIAKSSNNHWVASDLNEEHKGVVEPVEGQALWIKYIQGTIQLYGANTNSYNILIGGDLPIGAGLSASAALVCGLLVALQKITGKKESKEELISIASRVEREVIGLQGGIMDQFAIMLSKKNNVMFLDCRTKEYKFIPINLPKTKWLLINTKVKHQLIDTDYNERATECQRAVAIIRHQYPEVKSLRDVTITTLASIHLPPLLTKRVKFVIEENARVHEMVTALEKKDAVKAGQLLKASHKGLRYDYEVSSEELDHIADFANKFEGVHGARMMGGGFGGCVLVLVNEKTSNEFVTENADNYFMKYNSEPEVINFELGSGVEIV